MSSDHTRGGTWADIIRTVNAPFQPSPSQQEYFSEYAVQRQMTATRQAERAMMRASLWDDNYIRNMMYALGKQWPHFPLWPKILNLPPGA